MYLFPCYWWLGGFAITISISQYRLPNWIVDSPAYTCEWPTGVSGCQLLRTKSYLRLYTLESPWIRFLQLCSGATLHLFKRYTFKASKLVFLRAWIHWYFFFNNKCLNKVFFTHTYSKHLLLKKNTNGVMLCYLFLVFHIYSFKLYCYASSHWLDTALGRDGICSETG